MNYTEINFNHITNIHFTGIGGIGMSALAGLLYSKHYTITGSDKVEEFPIQNLKNLGITNINLPEFQNELPPKTELLIYSEAVPEEDKERQEAGEKGIPEMNYFQALGILSKAYKNIIAVAGTNGKTTTTSMLAKIFTEAGLNPTVIVGSFMLPEKQNFLNGSDEYLIVEACEYRKNFLPINPTSITITNIEAEHLDFFKDINDITDTFQEFVQKLPNSGKLILNGDNKQNLKLSHSGITTTYSIQSKSNTQAKRIEYQEGKTTFHIQETSIKLHVPGKFNVENALAATETALQYGISKEHIKKALENFQGSWRRFEKLGTYKKAIVISDYAHHPDAIQKTIQGAKNFYPNRRIISIFQPHQRSRTEKLFDDFIESLKESDIIILSEIYYVKGREKAIGRTAKDLGNMLKEQYKKEVYYAENPKEIPNTIKDIVNENDILLFMGAGDIYMTAENIIKE